MRIKASPTNQEYKITGLSELPCKEQTYVFSLTSIYFLCYGINIIEIKAHKCVLIFACYRFSLKQRSAKDENGDAQMMEITVLDYFVNHRHMELRYSADLPCINVGKPKRPTYIPLEVKNTGISRLR